MKPSSCNNLVADTLTTARHEQEKERHWQLNSS